MGKCHYPTIDVNDITAIENAVKDGWFTHGKRCDEFERSMARYHGLKYGLFVSSGSSASLLAVSTLTSWKLGEKRLKPDDEVITSALSFPTTVAPIVQNGLTPIFIDVDKKTCNVTAEKIQKTISARTKAVVIANTLGNPIDPEIRNVCDKNGLWLVEDNCDGLGGEVSGKKTGTIGHLSTLSFYPAHHITTGEGGMVLTNDRKLSDIAHSIRNWGRDCICQGGQDGVCNKRFSGKHGNMPEGYDHKYIFSHLGYNLKNTEIAAAMGLSQMNKLEDFIKRRKNNWIRYYTRIGDVLGTMSATEGSNPSWFGYLVICRSIEQRNDMVSLLEKNEIQTRMLFAGNILRQPCFTNGHHWFRVADTFCVSNDLTDKAFWLGVAPSVTEEQIDKTCDLIIGMVAQ